jgi:hypothetical protein
MTRRAPRRTAVVAACLLLVGCRAGTPSADPAESTAPRASAHSSAVAPRPALGTDASTDLPAYAGPPAHAPRSSGPITRVRAAIDLTAAAPDTHSSVRFAAATPDGGAYVLLTPGDSLLPPRLGTVPPGGTRVSSSLPVGLDDVWGMHLLADGEVVLTGGLSPTWDTPHAYGFAVVDPGRGDVRTTVVVPFGPPPALATGRSALGPDGRTLYLFLSVSVGAGPRERLVEADALSGRVLSDRDLSNDLAAVSQTLPEDGAVGLVPRPRGGVTLIVDATPDATRPQHIPTLLSYDAGLRPARAAVRVTSAAEAAVTQAFAGGIDGTVFLLARVATGAWLLAVPDGGGAGPVLVSLADATDASALVVEPAQVWGLVPAPAGARAVDLVHGVVRPPIALGCPGAQVRDMVPASRGIGALLIGECAGAVPMLWELRP